MQRPGGPDNLNVFWLNLAQSSVAQADLDAVIDSLVAAYNTRFAGFISTGATIAEARASWIYSAGNVLESDRVYSDACTGGTGIDSLAVCYVIDWKITDYYRGGKPRTYLPGVVQSASTDARTLTSTARSSLATAAQGFRTDVNAITHGGITAVTLGVVRFASQNAWLNPPVFRAYTTASVRSILGTQRRRYGGS